MIAYRTETHDKPVEEAQKETHSLMTQGIETCDKAFRHQFLCYFLSSFIKITAENSGERRYCPRVFLIYLSNADGLFRMPATQTVKALADGRRLHYYSQVISDGTLSRLFEDIVRRKTIHWGWNKSNYWSGKIPAKRSVIGLNLQSLQDGSFMYALAFHKTA